LKTEAVEARMEAARSGIDRPPLQTATGAGSQNEPPPGLARTKIVDRKALAPRRWPAEREHSGVPKSLHNASLAPREMCHARREASLKGRWSAARRRPGTPAQA